MVRYGIPALALLCAALLVWGAAYVADRRWRAAAGAAAGAGSWLTLTGLAAASGLLARFELRPPPFLLMMIGTVALGIALGASRLGAKFARGIPLAALVLAQSFRLSLELVMHHAATTGVMPMQLTFTGYNFDIVTGASALVLGLFLLARPVPPWIVAIWNVWGFACLAVIAAIAVTTSPFVRAFGEGSINVWVAYFPYVWLPVGCVVFALAGHIVVLRKLRAELHASALAAPATR